MANSSATERVERPRTEVGSRGQVLPFSAASYKTRQYDADLRVQFERLLIFVLCALWGLGLALLALIAIANWTHGAPSATAAVDFVSSSPFSAGAQYPVTLTRHFLGW